MHTEQDSIHNYANFYMNGNGPLTVHHIFCDLTSCADHLPEN